MEKKNNSEILNQIKGGLIVSCQALPTEPLCDPYIMSKTAYAAFLGGAVGIRANTRVDILAVRERVPLPIIGIVKKEYPDSEVYITPTMEEIDVLAEIGCEIIAFDATARPRPNGLSFEKFFKGVREKYPDRLFMADTSSFDEGKLALELGADILATTMSGYTPYTKNVAIPDFALARRYARELGATVIVEGGIWTPEQLVRAFECGAHAAVVGTAITRPMEITKRFVKALKDVKK